MEPGLLQKAGVTTAEAASIVGVSHVMMWKYLRGSGSSRPVLKRRLQTLERVLQKLVEKGALPRVDVEFARRMHPEKRMRRDVMISKIKALVDQHAVLPVPIG